MRKEKQLLLDEIKETFESPTGVVVTQYDKLDSNATAEFRAKLNEAGAKYVAVKKRMLLKAAEQLGFELDKSQLEGHIGVMETGENFVEATKALCAFAKEHKKSLEILSGRFEGKAVSKDDVVAISQLPSQDEMRAQMLGLFEAPMSQTLAVMESLLTSVIYCLDNKAKESEQAG